MTIPRVSVPAGTAGGIASPRALTASVSTPSLPAGISTPRLRVDVMTPSLQEKRIFPQRMTTVHFNCTIDMIELGSFTGIEGLTAQYEIKTYAEGGENGYVHQLPGRLSYGTVKLTRPLSPLSAGERTPLTTWFRAYAEDGTFVRHTASIVALDHGRTPLAQWNFTGVWPVKYAGPSFSTDSGKMATEVFEFAHDGFSEVAPK